MTVKLIASSIFGIQCRNIILSWHLVSVILLLIAVGMSRVTATEITTLDASTSSSSALLPVLASANSSSNDSEPAKGPQAPDCSVNVDEECPDNLECNRLGGDCINCTFNESCIYGTKQKAICTPKQFVNCTGNQTFEREYECRYCYQLPQQLTWCNKTIDCALNRPRNYYPARPFYVSTCWTKKEYLCMGRRCFPKQLSCNWSQGYKWSTALLLSIFLGGFGVDRFYLGLWREGIGKLLSFGGLGVWTLVDVILISVGYVGPWDGSLYI
ncbi:TM2 domain-containing protein 3-like [Physella acuta]|uniref:TM2 domain-containing protein 3-like n=1 Tax=Physella acuta TaxID=109671 RepID=UPI0027DCDFB6|nr:TM2 domain-containing protein 3-like [Physella acuta]